MLLDSTHNKPFMFYKIMLYKSRENVENFNDKNVLLTSLHGNNKPNHFCKCDYWEIKRVKHALIMP